MLIFIISLQNFSVVYVLCAPVCETLNVLSTVCSVPNPHRAKIETRQNLALFLLKYASFKAVDDVLYLITWYGSWQEQKKNLLMFLSDKKSFCSSLKTIYISTQLRICKLVAEIYIFKMFSGLTFKVTWGFQGHIYLWHTDFQDLLFQITHAALMAILIYSAVLVGRCLLWDLEC